VLFLLLVSFRHRNPLIANSGDQLTTIVAFWLIFADSGRVWAVDALMRTRDRSGWNRTWALRCLQIQFCMIYFVSFVQKLGDDDWTSGTTMFYVLTNVRMWTVPLNGLLDYPLLLKTVTYATLVLEATLPFLIWHRRTRYVWITLSALFHSSIGLLLGIPAFSLYMLSMLTLFIPFTANASASASSANSRSRGPTLN